MNLLFFFFSKILHTPVIGNHFNYHHIALFQKTPFNTTEYKDVYAVDFSPCGNFVEVVSGKKLKGVVRVVHIKKCRVCDIRERIFSEEILGVDEMKKFDKGLYNKIQKWDPYFQLYGRNCQDFVKYLI